MKKSDLEGLAGANINKCSFEKEVKQHQKIFFALSRPKRILVFVVKRDA